LIERFGNRAIHDALPRPCADTSQRIPRWLNPVVTANLRQGGETDRSAFMIAAWARYAAGVDEAGEPIEINDPQAGHVSSLARRARHDPEVFAADRGLFGALADDEVFRSGVAKRLSRIWQVGIRQALAELNDAG
jgi:mannitol 2-dehydrogenase